MKHRSEQQSVEEVDEEPEEEEEAHSNRSQSHVDSKWVHEQVFSLEHWEEEEKKEATRHSNWDLISNLHTEMEFHLFFLSHTHLSLAYLLTEQGEARVAREAFSFSEA